MIPFFTPLLMFGRISAVTPPAWQIGLSIVVMAVSVVAATWAAARIFRVGVLMYGKRPTFRQMAKWLRQS
jgi:ABC-2 type transport system permease protein